MAHVLTSGCLPLCACDLKDERGGHPCSMSAHSHLLELTRDRFRTRCRCSTSCVAWRRTYTTQTSLRPVRFQSTAGKGSQRRSCVRSEIDTCPSSRLKWRSLKHVAMYCTPWYALYSKLTHRQRTHSQREEERVSRDVSTADDD